MGSWNGTCGITNLPIRSGDRIAAFLIAVPLERNDDFSGFCYAGQPMTLPFFGEYNDYGGIENVEESFVTKEIMSHFKRDESFEDFINDQVERDKIKVQDGYFKYGVGLWVVHRDIYDKLCKIDRVRYDGKTTSQAFVDRVDRSGAIVTMTKPSWLKNAVSNELRHYGDMYTLIHTESLDDNMDLVLDFLRFVMSMHSLRKSFIPQGGKGSQEEDFGMAKLLADETIKLLEKFRQKDIKNIFSEEFSKDPDETDEEWLNYQPEKYYSVDSRW